MWESPKSPKVRKSEKPDNLWTQSLRWTGIPESGLNLKR